MKLRRLLLMRMQKVTKMSKRILLEQKRVQMVASKT